MKQDKFLTGILIGIGALIVLALVLFFMRQDTRTYVSDSTPEGVVNNYILAVLDKDYEKAYSYLADLENKPTQEEFRQSFFNGIVNPENTGVSIGNVDVSGNDATVNLTIYYSYNDPFSSSYGNSDRANLVRQNGAWKISYMPYSFWAYDWYQDY
ncbi:MAG: Lumazine-binding domain protein [Chloroflexi bacterium OLB14]|nr:MAG: Lumazine-binding domain protein [Chloroflexi bacterium OLB14]